MAEAMLRDLRLDETVEVARVGHRLALGVQWIDALTQLPIEAPAGAAWLNDLEAIGTRPIVQRLEAHSQGRHAIRHAGRYRKLLDHTVAEGDPLAHAVRAFGARDARVAAYATAQDPRRYVPRRVAFTPVLAGGVPPASVVNTRTAWLWPGAAYPLPSRSTGLRGRIRREASPGVHATVPWTRVIVTRAGAGPASFATEAQIGWAHGDDRGEFLLVLGNGALSGAAALPAALNLNVWVFLPPALPAFNAADPLASLPLESAGTDAINDVLKGLAVPPSYVPQAVRSLSLALGEVRAMSDADLLFV